MPLLDTLMSMASPQVLSSIASQTGESQAGIQNGLKGGIAAVLAALATKAGDSAFLQQILQLISSKANDPAILSDLGSLASGQASPALKDLASQFLSTVFGSSAKQSTVSELVGESAGIKPSSAASVMSMAAPMVMAVLGKEPGLSASSLSGLLSAELPGLSKYLPAGLGTLTAVSAPKHAAAAHHHEEEEKSSGTGGAGWVLPALIGLLLLGGLFWWFFQSKETEVAVKPAEPVAEAPKNLWAALGEFGKRKLPDGTELSIPKLGVENRLIDFIEDPTKLVDKETWFDFDRLLFDTGKATLQPASQDQLKDVAAILKAYPKVHMRIGGYTDNVGDKAANQKLSEDRASNVMAELVTLGVDKSRLDSKGYGEEHPVGSNDTEAGRAQNRRISMRVTQK